MTKAVVYAPGKLVLAGEVSVVEVGNVCLVTALDAGIEVRAQEYSKWILHAPDIGVYNQTLSEKKESENPGELATCAIKSAVAWLEICGKSIHPLHISILSKISSIALPKGITIKPGLGSSSAMVVAVIGSVLKAHEYPYDSQLLFKLAALAQCNHNGILGSGCDIAAAAFNSTVIYSRFDPDWLRSRLNEAWPLEKIINEPWPALMIKSVNLPQNLTLVVGFTGKSVKTSDVLFELEAFRQRLPHDYAVIMADLDIAARMCISAVIAGDTQQVPPYCTTIMNIFQHLERASGIQCLSQGLERLISIAGDFGVGAKQSGACGGDCGIAFCWEKTQASELKKTWSSQGIIPLDVSIKH